MTSQRAALLGGVLGMLVVGGGVITGCGDDTTGTSGSSGTTGTTGTVTGTTGTVTGTTGTVTGTTGTVTGTTGTASGSGDAGPDSTVTTPEGGSKPDATVDSSTDAGADADAATACNSNSVVADGGTLIFSFDNGVITGWSPVVQTASPTLADGGDAGPPSTTVAAVPTPFDTCPGALELTAEFTNYNQQVSAQYNNNSPPALITATTVHMALKLVLPNDTDGSAAPFLALQNIQPYLNGFLTQQLEAGAYSAFIGTNVYPPSLADGAWHNVEFPLGAADAGPVQYTMQQLGVDIVSLVTPPDAGVPFAPLNAILYVDDVWYE